MLETLAQEKRPAILKFAPWAVMNKPFTKEKHYLDGKKICFNVKSGEEYANHIEMSGYFCSAIISYGADESGVLRRLNHVVFPSFRMYPNRTNGSFDYNYKSVTLRCNGIELVEKAVSFVFDGVLHLTTDADKLVINRYLFAAPECKALIELIKVKNLNDTAVTIEAVNNEPTAISEAKHGHCGQQYKTFVQVDTACVTVGSGETVDLSVAYCAAMPDEALLVDCEREYQKRIEFLNEISEKFIVATPDNTVNVMAHYAKIRAVESIFKTKSGLMHSPGGGNYYAALWTNDQCEYVNPFFANLGYGVAIKQSLNSYKLYQKYISPDKAVITSIISEGDGIWHGAGDRGDSAMYAYGCSRFLLALGDKGVAQKYIGSIRDCLEYTISQINEYGVIKSDADELENRFESGNANLSTSCLAYDAFISAAYLEKELGFEDKAERFMTEAKKLGKAIESYFGKTVEGYATYMYCEEEKNLRAWICWPLVVGINTRAKETARALISEKLRMGEGLITRSGEKTFWDRSTLYSLRGLFYAGLSDLAQELFLTYSKARLLGEHIPYAVEAFPEGNQAQLSAESGLYLRIFTEGILGYRPTGFKSFEVKPNLPAAWDKLEIKNIALCGRTADIKIVRNDGSYILYIKSPNKELTVKCDDKVDISF